ncbi:lanthionine synthetase C family protein, partial [Streptomyces sp. NPDC087850]
GTPRYGPALNTLHQYVTDLAHRRVRAANIRIDRGAAPPFAEYDVLHGLTGIGAYFLRSAPGSDALGAVLAYLVRLTRPLLIDDQTVPGWWCSHDPHVGQSYAFPGGHANFGVAHGIAGPLALLAHAARRGITVEGHTDAMDVITRWLDDWRQEGEPGGWWPQWITLKELVSGRTTQPGPARPSWCYGTPGIARAGQLATIANGDTRNQQYFEGTLSNCLADPVQTNQLIDTSLCHGWAGVYQTVWRAAHDTTNPVLRAILPRLANALTRQAHTGTGNEPGFLEGDAGAALSLHTATRDTTPISGWDACLLIS